METNNIRAQGGSSCPERPGIIWDTLMPGALDYQGQRVQLGWIDEGKQVLRTLAYFRNQLRFKEFKKSHGFQKKAQKKFGWSPGPFSLSTVLHKPVCQCTQAIPCHLHRATHTPKTQQGLWLGGSRVGWMRCHRPHAWTLAVSLQTLACHSVSLRYTRKTNFITCFGISSLFNRDHWDF